MYNQRKNEFELTLSGWLWVHMCINGDSLIDFIKSTQPISDLKRNTHNKKYEIFQS